MSQPVLLKVYAGFAPAPAAKVQALEEACATAIAEEGADQPIVSTLDDMVRISFEGLYFPVDEVADVLADMAAAGATGKMDVLDLENWRMTRFEAREHGLHRSSAPLNNVLDFSGF